MKIILFSPVRQPARLLREALDSFKALEGVAERWYYDDNDDPESSALLVNEYVLPKVDFGQEEYRRDGETHVWTPTLMNRMARIRNHGIAHFLGSDADLLFIVDTDVFPHPQTALHLASLGKEIVSEVYWTKWRPEQPYQPNAWDFHDYGFFGTGNILRLREPGTYEVGGLGAITLIDRSVFEMGVDYTPIKTLAPTLPGEDRHFCIRATAEGFKLWADTHFPPFHVYRDEQFAEMKRWRRDGCHPGYFRRYWLNEQWRKQVEAI